MSVTTIPTDVIYQIFALFATPLAVPGLSRFPWFLGHICSRWRSIFLSMTTDFWSNIRLSFWDSSANYDHARSMVQFFLKRNPNDLFSFTFELSDNLSTAHLQHEGDAVQILNMLIDESTRWKAASFVLIRNSTYSNLVALVRAKDRLSQLQNLSLYFPHQTLSYSAEMEDIFRPAASLTTIEVTGELADGMFNWSNLKAVTLTRCTFKNPATLLHMTNLESLSIRLKQPILFDGIVCLPRLRTLDCDAGILQLLQTPALTDFTIDHALSSDTTLSFIHRSACNILRLCIKECVASIAVQIIAHTPLITQLVLVDITHLDLVLEQLAISKHSACQWEPWARHMSSLYLNRYFQRGGLGPLSTLIVSRTVLAAGDSHQQLQKLGIHTMRSLPEIEMLCRERKVEYLERLCGYTVNI